MFERRWISARECADYLHFHLQSVYKLFYAGKIPGGRVGRSLRLDKQKIDSMLSGGLKKR